MREGLPQFSHPISHRTPHYRMGKDGIVLLIAIKKRPIFRRQRDCKIQDDIDGNSLGNRYRVPWSFDAMRRVTLGDPVRAFMIVYAYHLRCQ